MATRLRFLNSRGTLIFLLTIFTLIPFSLAGNFINFSVDFDTLSNFTYANPSLTKMINSSQELNLTQTFISNGITYSISFGYADNSPSGYSSIDNYWNGYGNQHRGRNSPDSTGFLITFDTPVRVTNNSRINFLSNYSTNGGGSYIKIPEIIFLDDDDVCITMFSSESNYAGNSYNNICDQELIQSCAGHLSRLAKDITQFQEQYISDCGWNQSRLNSVKDIKRLWVDTFSSTSFDGNDANYLDEFNFVNFFNGTNQLPYFNITFQEFCLENKQNITEINYNITSSDIEGDSTSFGILKTTNFNKGISKVVRYYEPFLWFNIPDYTPVENVYNPGQYCYVNTKAESNLSMHDFYSYGDEWFLSLNGGCEGIPEYIYDLGYSLENLFYSTELFNIQYQDMLNFTFYDQEFNKVVQFNLNGTDSNIKLYEWNGTGLEYLANISYTAFTEFSINKYANNTKNLFLDFVDNQVINITDLNNNSIRYVGIAIKNGVVMQTEFAYSGIQKNPTSILFNTGFVNVSYGNNYFKFYGTDNVHPNEYRTKEYNVKGVLCANYFDNTINDEPSTTNFNPLKSIRTELGLNWENYLNSLGYYEIGKSILYYLIIFAFFSLIFSSFFLTGSFIIVPSLFVVSLGGIIISFLVGYTGNLIVFLITCAFALALMFSGDISGGRKDG